MISSLPISVSVFHGLIIALIVIPLLHIVLKVLKKKIEKINNITVVDLFIYPIKSCKGIKLEECDIVRKGFKYDRIWLVVDSQDNMVTQRQIPKMALISTNLSDNRLLVTYPGMNCLEIPCSEPINASLRDVTVWGETVEAADMGDIAAKWFSQTLKQEGLRLVRFADHFVRNTDQNLAPKGQTAFADKYPFLLASVESMADLNSRLVSPVTLEHFRPNIVVQGVAPYEEDSWKQITINNATTGCSVVFNVVRSCSRCKIPTNNPVTGVMDAGNEPTKTLRAYRSGSHLGLIKKTDVFFGRHLDHESKASGSIRVGDHVSVEQ